MTIPNQQIQSFHCENCGGTIKWNIARQALECSSCKAPFPVECSEGPVLEHDFQEYTQLEQEAVAFPEQTMVTCGICGAQIAFDRDSTAEVCPMCGSSQVMAAKQTAGVAPDGLIPFRVDKQDAQQRFRKWVTSRWFAPNRLKQAYQEGKLEGVYLPFWTFDVKAVGQYRGAGGREYTVTDKDGKEQVKVRWFPVSGTVCGSYDDLQVCAAGGKVQENISDVLPYSTQESSIPYNSVYLSGFAAERYAIPANEALEKAKQTVRSDLKGKADQDIRMRRGFDRARVDNLDLRLQYVGYKHILLPAWVSAFSYGGKQYTYLINGETGEVAGNRPYSVPKILAAVAAAVTAVVLICGLLSGCGMI